MEFDLLLTILFPEAKMPPYKLVEKLKRGVFMNGLILSDCGSACSCGGTFKTTHNKIINAKFPTCQTCGNPPGKLRLKKSFPAKDGTIFYGWFREIDGKPLTSVMECIELIGRLNKEIMSVDFRIEKYISKAREKMTANFLFKEYLEHSLNRTTLPQKHRKHLSPGGYRKIKTNVTFHLIPYFKERTISDGSKVPWFIDEINNQKVIQQFYDSYTDRFRARDNATGELKAFLGWVMDEKGYISSRAKFPELDSAREIDEEEIPDIDIQVQIIEAIEKRKYRDMFIVAATLAIRPSELTAYHVGDVDHLNLRVKTGRHFSDGGAGFERAPVEGRKSIKGHEKLGVVTHKIDQYLSDLLKKYTEGRDPGEPLFKGERSKYVSQTALRDAWRAACEKLGVKFTSYAGTKHATLSSEITKHGDWDQLIRFSKHSDTRTAKRYAKNKSEEPEISSERFVESKGAELVQADFENVISLRNYRAL